MAGEDRSAPLPRTDRVGAPAYLLRYLERRAGEAAEPVEPDGEGPLYLRRFRARRAAAATAPSVTVPEALGPDQAGWTEAWLRTVRTKEIVPPPEARPKGRWLDIHVVRHAETQGYSTDAGLTPLGKWQARRRGHDLSKGLAEGSVVRLVCAPTARATETAEQIAAGIADGLEMWGRRVEVVGPEPREAFRNFQVWTPDGPRDPTEAFRRYHAVLEEYERTAVGDRPLWLVELDRFWRLQNGGGDPIAFWATTPLLHFEPPSLVVLRFLAGFAELAAEVDERTRIVLATHSGPMRGLAMWAFGHDPGEPYNTEEVRVKLRPETREAVVTFRNRTQEIHVPAPEEWPEWAAPVRALAGSAATPGGSS
jgi:broad specificity phosphatase PhoE